MVEDQGILKGLSTQIAQCGNSAIYTYSGAVVDLMSCVRKRNANRAMQMHGGGPTLTDCTIRVHPIIESIVQRRAELVETQ
jgi:hypothetical protein